MSAPAKPIPHANEELLARIASLESALAAARAQVEALTAERDQLRASHERLRQDLELFRRRIYVAQAERVDTRQLEIEFAEKLAELTKIERRLDEELAAEAAEASAPAGNDGKRSKSRVKPTGRRDLQETSLPKERIEFPDPVLEALVARGEAVRIGFEESARLGWKRGGHVCIVLARATYRIESKTPETQPETSSETTPETTVESTPETSPGETKPETTSETAHETTVESTPETTPGETKPDTKPETTKKIATAPLPPEVFRRSMAAPSLLAHIIVDKHADGLPLNRIENRFARDGLRVDRGTMCRWLEDAGATFGATVVAAARQEAIRTAFCIATDATGVRVQPGPSPDGKRRSCRKGNYFVLLADRDHAFFEYTAKETSAFVAEMFKGFSGYVQADAKSVYDVLYVDAEERRRRLKRRTPGGELDVDDCVRREVACWTHCRRGFWEATIAKNAVAREGLARIGRIFALEERWVGRKPDEIREFRQKYARPHVESFFAWAELENEKVKGTRGLLQKALGYALRHKAALMRYLEDGRLVLDNNRSERALRSIATGRKGWLFVGSDDHGVAAGHLLSGVASCRLHDLDPEAYFRDVFRIVAHWPRDRYLELAPKYWAATRSRLDPVQLAAEFGPLTVPPPLPVPEQQAAS